MSKNRLRRVTLVVTVAALFLSGCGGNSKEQERLRRDAENMVYEAYTAKDYPRIIELVDSFKPLGSFSEGKACYWLGYAYDRMMRERSQQLQEWQSGQQKINNLGTLANIYGQDRSQLSDAIGNYYSTVANQNNADLETMSDVM